MAAEIEAALGKAPHMPAPLAKKVVKLRINRGE